MKQEEKTRQTRERILQAAITEFGSQNYASVTLNSICKKHKISKGLVYYNFENKDELYLCCVSQCFERFTSYLKTVNYVSDSVKTSINILLKARQTFMNENPYFRNIFFNVILSPATHLERDLKNITREYQEYIKNCYKTLFSGASLKMGVNVDTAVEYLLAFQDIYNGYYQSKAYQEQNFTQFIEDHEKKISKLLDIILYGICEERM